MVMDPTIVYKEKLARLKEELNEVEENGHDWYRIRSEISIMNRNIKMAERMKKSGVKF